MGIRACCGENGNKSLQSNAAARYLAVERCLKLCLKVGVNVEVSLHGPEVFMAVTGGRDNLEANESEGIEDHRTRTAQADPMSRIPIARFVLHTVRKLALQGQKNKNNTTCLLYNCTCVQGSHYIVKQF